MLSRTSATTPVAVAPRSSRSMSSRSRCASTAAPGGGTSSGSTKSRPSRSAQAWAARYSATLARGDAAEPQVGMVAGGAHEVDHVALHLGRDAHGASRRAERDERLGGIDGAPRQRLRAAGSAARSRARRPPGIAERIRTRKRSSCASGSANVPSSSIGFCVASTRNGSGRGRLSPSTETCRSCMASSRADCVRGVARLISSTSRTFVKIGPGMNRNRALVDAGARDVGGQQVRRSLDALRTSGPGPARTRARGASSRRRGRPRSARGRRRARPRPAFAAADRPRRRRADDIDAAGEERYRGEEPRHRVMRSNLPSTAASRSAIVHRRAPTPDPWMASVQHAAQLEVEQFRFRSRRGLAPDGDAEEDGPVQRS